jgi:hypothetical protein
VAFTAYHGASIVMVVGSPMGLAGAHRLVHAGYQRLRSRPATLAATTGDVKPLSDADTAPIEDHLLMCEDCRARLAEWDGCFRAMRAVMRGHIQAVAGFHSTSASVDER